MKDNTHTNNLIYETSPYLLQHAHNPVDWEAWHPKILQKAKEKNKLLLISIGYASCHWCHVMEHDCFEDVAVAETMNRHFINIKIDREERPDIDHIYMDALQMMTGSGGWPLNIVALPDGRPFWGATYVKKEDWITVLGQLSKLYAQNPEKVVGYAQNLAEGIQQINLVDTNTESDLYGMKELESAIENWSGYFDTFLGGYKRAPKFMMPVHLDFLLHYGTATNHIKILDYVHTTLTRIGYGGVFDHVGGGFSRYAVDTKWHVPHFEKMLYDNGQLIGVYAKAYAATKDDLYKELVEKTIHFVSKELMSKDFAFYSSLDADSLTENQKLEEGAYYVWKETTLKTLLESDFEIFKDYYNINSYGHWEDGRYVLIRDSNESDIIEKYRISKDDLALKMKRCLHVLRKEREQRAKPRLDDKILTSWNGLMLKGLIDAHKYLRNDHYLDLALNNANFIVNHMLQKDGSLFRSHTNGKSTIHGYLEDYATIIDAFAALYEVTFDEAWLRIAKQLTDFCLENFFDSRSQLFFFTAKNKDYIIRRTLEVTDNVIPSSNSIMALNLFRMSRLFPKEKYAETAVQMLRNIQHNFDENAQGHANWLHLVLYTALPFYEVAIIGNDYKTKAKEINAAYLPHKILAATEKEKEDELSVFANRHSVDQTLLYICDNGACQLPLTQIKEVLTQLRSNETP